MIEEKITISFDYQDFTFAQQVDDECEIGLDIEDREETLITVWFENEQQIQKVIDNLHRQMNILRDAKKNSTEVHTD